MKEIGTLAAGGGTRSDVDRRRDVRAGVVPVIGPKVTPAFVEEPVQSAGS